MKIIFLFLISYRLIVCIIKVKVTVCLILYNALEVPIDTLQCNFQHTQFIILTLRLKMEYLQVSFTLTLLYKILSSDPKSHYQT